jgi:uncharacterized protein (TIGR02266 family)
MSVRALQRIASPMCGADTLAPIPAPIGGRRTMDNHFFSTTPLYDDEAPTVPRLAIEGRSDLRACPRSPLQVEVSLESESQFFAGLTRDVSLGGVFVATYRMLAVGSRVEVRLDLPDGPLDASGTVRWTRGPGDGLTPGIGISFEQIDADGLRRIVHFCEHRPPLYYEA